MSDRCQAVWVGVMTVDRRDGSGAIRPWVTTVVYALPLGRWSRWARNAVSAPGFPRLFLRLGRAGARGRRSWSTGWWCCAGLGLVGRPIAVDWMGCGNRACALRWSWVPSRSASPIR